MKIKKLSLAIILLVITLIAYVAATILCCYTTKPEVLTGEFAFSINYEYKGKTGTLSGVVLCEFSGSSTIGGEHNRYWNQETIYDNANSLEYPYIIEENDELLTTLSLQENMVAGYFMGDPLYEDHYIEHGCEGPEPYVQYYDYTNDIYLDEGNKDEILESIGFKIINFTYAEPIENSFSFSGIQYEADNVSTFAAIMVLYLVLCLVCIRKDTEYQYSKLDKIGVGINFILGIFVLPLITFFCMIFGLVESNVELINQIIYNIPSFSILCLALSVVLRRIGFSKTGFYIQFGGIPMFLIILILDTLV